MDHIFLWIILHGWKIGLISLAVIAFAIIFKSATSNKKDSTSSGKTTRRGLASFFRKKQGFDEQTRKELRETLVAADFGPQSADKIIEALTEKVSTTTNDAQLATALRDAIAESIEPHCADLNDMVPDGGVLLLVGINGSGKTTTVAKIAHRWQQDGRDVILGAADTFRAAAAEQLQTWGERLAIRVVKQNAGADPAAVAFDTVKAAASSNSTVIIDTAGRIHGDQGLMNELTKIVRVVRKARDDAPHGVLLTLDAAQGQTAIEQAKKFSDAVPVSGVILNKIDGEGRAGYALTIAHELRLPVVAVGVGEGIEDIEPFDAFRYANRIVFDNPDGASAGAESV